MKAEENREVLKKGTNERWTGKMRWQNLSKSEREISHEKKNIENQKYKGLGTITTGKGPPVKSLRDLVQLLYITVLTYSENIRSPKSQQGGKGVTKIRHFLKEIPFMCGIIRKLVTCTSVISVLEYTEIHIILCNLNLYTLLTFGTLLRTNYTLL